MTLKSSRSLWFRSFCLGLNAAKWEQCADHWVGQTEGTRNLWSFTGVDLTTTVGPLWERGINSVNAIKTQGGRECEWTARSWLGKINFPVRNVINFSPVSLCIPLSNPNLGFALNWSALWIAPPIQVKSKMGSGQRLSFWQIFGLP